MQLKKAASVAAVAVGVLAGAGSAYAGAFNHSTTGGHIYGSYAFQPQSVSQGAFEWWGTVDDTSNDGNAMKVQVRVEGYGYNTFENAKDTDKYWDQYVYDYQALQTNFAAAKICRDRGTLYPDNCSSEVSYYR
jgi:hypothetical protein